MISPAGVIGAAWEVQQKLSRAELSFCFIGGLALQRWGEPRYTQDVDLTLLCPFGEELALGRSLAELFQPRFDGAVEFSVESRVFLAQTADGTPIDIAFGAIDFELRCVDRASSFDFGGGVSLRTCCAEDLIVMKVFANRNRDWPDVESIVMRRGTKLDWELIERELKPLLAIQGGQPVWDRLRELRQKLSFADR
jgi:hypothetical protein